MSLCIDKRYMDDANFEGTVAEVWWLGAPIDAIFSRAETCNLCTKKSNNLKLGYYVFIIIFFFQEPNFNKN